MVTRWGAADLLLVLLVGLTAGCAKIDTVLPDAWDRSEGRNEVGGIERASGRVAPDFDLVLFSGDELKLSDLKGNVVVLNFWASYCVPCRWEMPAFEAVWKEYRDRGVVFVGIAVGDTEEAAAVFADEVGVSYSLGSDEDGGITVKYRVAELPTTFIIDRDGNEVRRFNVANEAVLRLYLDGQIRGGS